MKTTPEIPAAGDEKPWMRAFGALRDLSEETALINTIIEEEFGRIDQEDWQWHFDSVARLKRIGW
jgi:hypothetical protein